MKSGRNYEERMWPIPMNGGARSGPEFSGIESDPTILKVTGLRFPASNQEVDEKPQRRKFTASYKLKILREADECSERGELGALLRREGLYHSHLQKWRRLRMRGETKELEAKKRGRKAKLENPLTKETQRLNRENRRLREDLRKAKIIIDVQKKISELLGIEQPEMNLEEME